CNSYLAVIVQRRPFPGNKIFPLSARFSHAGASGTRTLAGREECSARWFSHFSVISGDLARNHDLHFHAEREPDARRDLDDMGGVTDQSFPVERGGDFGRSALEYLHRWLAAPPGTKHTLGTLLSGLAEALGADAAGTAAVIDQEVVVRQRVAASGL